ncbi:MAG: DUF302 domain-containing protein [Candidatus Gracilibacteria bacterium]|nr:DUF302 domain-containing protein [Candidatus Gracilibacteria bacterium]
MKNFGYTKEVTSSFSEAIDDINFALLEQGFGILTQIDMQKNLKTKLNKDIEEYIILGACNPQFANEAMEIEYEIGLLLPCNVVVFKKRGRVFVSTIMPTVLMRGTGADNMDLLAKKVEKKLIKAVDSI